MKVPKWKSRVLGRALGLKLPRWVDGSLRCSFCGKPKGQVEKLIVGPRVYICNECIGLCNKIMAKERGPGPVDSS
jgi:hypothetical protein